IIRHGAKMVSAMAEASVPKISVIVRKAYGAGLYAMAGPAFEPDACLALPSAQIAVMGPEAAVNAVYANKIAALPEEERAAFIEEKREEYKEDINIYHLASEMVIDGIIPANSLRTELVNRFEAYSSKYLIFSERKHPVYPV
ncbi:MAG: carboxyl transferase domain-containing protein, partial [Bacillota bacterium]|nr:carboxyl transferase domain-containing protein [Bacillota bacterium]